MVFAVMTPYYLLIVCPFLPAASSSNPVLLLYNTRLDELVDMGGRQKGHIESNQSVAFHVPAKGNLA